MANITGRNKLELVKWNHAKTGFLRNGAGRAEQPKGKTFNAILIDNLGLARAQDDRGR